MKFSAEEIFQEIELQAPKFKVSPKDARAIFLAENTADGVLKQGAQFRGDRVSPKQARGLFQTLPSTEKALQAQGFLPSTWSFSPEDLRGQVSAGLAAMQEMVGRQKRPGDIKELGVMYNAGTVPWEAYLRGDSSRIPAETKSYWQKLDAANGIMEKPMGAQAIEKAASQSAASPAQGAQSSASSSSRTSNRINVWNNPELFAATMSAGSDIVSSGGSIDGAMHMLSSLAQQRIAAEQAQTTAIGAGAAAIGAATEAEYAVSAKAAQRRANNLFVANLHPDQISNRFQQASDAINQIDMEMEPLGQEIDARSAVGFYDNPLEWLVNQTRLPGMVGQYNALARKQNRAVASAKELQSLTSTQQSLTTSIDSDEIAAAGVAKAKAEASRAQEILSRVQQEHAGAAARDVATQVQLIQGKFDTNARMLAFTREVQTATEGLSEREASRVAMEMEVGKINQYLKMIGSNTQHNAASYKLMPAAERQLLLNSAGTGVIAGKFSEAAEIINARGSLARMAQEGDSTAVNWFKKATTEAQIQTDKELVLAEQQAKITGKPVKREEILLQNLDKVQQRFLAEANDMSTASEYNPLKLDLVAAAKNPALAANPVSIFINKYGPSSAEPVFQKLDEKKLFDRFTTAVMKGAMPPQVAVDALHQFFTLGSQAQAVRTKYVLFGISKPESYTVAVPKPGFFAGDVASGKVDLWDRASIERFLTTDIALRSVQQPDYWLNQQINRGVSP